MSTGNEPTATPQSMLNAYASFCDIHPDGKCLYPTYSDWMCSNDEKAREFRRGWAGAWKKANLINKEK